MSIFNTGYTPNGYVKNFAALFKLVVDIHISIRGTIDIIILQRETTCTY